MRALLRVSTHYLCAAPTQVDVVGVEGELKEVAMRALQTRPNFAYLQKEASSVLQWGGRKGDLLAQGQQQQQQQRVVRELVCAEG